MACSHGFLQLNKLHFISCSTYNIYFNVCLLPSCPPFNQDLGRVPSLISNPDNISARSVSPFSAPSASSSSLSRPEVMDLQTLSPRIDQSPAPLFLKL